MEAGHDAQQLVNKSPRSIKLLRAGDAKPLGQSTPNFGSILGDVTSITTPKESARFVPKRPVDAHFRSAPSEALTPNRCEPPRQTRATATQGPLLHRPRTSSRLAQPFARHGLPNIAPSAPFVESAADRRQRPSASQKFGSGLDIEGSKQQKNPELSICSQASATQQHTAAEGNRLHDQFRGEFKPQDRH